MDARCTLLAGGDRAVRLEAGPWRALHLERGALELGCDGASARQVGAGEGLALGRSALDLRPTADDTRFRIWQIMTGPGAMLPLGLAELLAHDLADTPCLAGPAICVRLERVDLAPGAQTPVHTHAGPGLRVLVAGTLRAEVGEIGLSLTPGDVWLERGPGEPVVGRADLHHSTAFVRLMLLPEATAGQDSFVHWHEGETTRARPARYQRFFEERVIL